MNLRKVIMKYGRLVVFIRHDSAEIWGFKYGITLVIGTLKITASTGVFVRKVCALKHPIKNVPSAPCMILTLKKH
jgi:mevalonate kinase